MISTSYIRHAKDLSAWHIMSKGLIEKGNEACFVSPNDAESSKDFEVLDKVQIHRFNYFWPRSSQKLAYYGGMPTNLRKGILGKVQLPFFMLAFLLKTLKVSKECDLIHAHFSIAGFVAVLAGKLNKKPVVVSVYRLISGSKIENFFDKFVLENADFVIFGNQYTMNEAKKVSSKIKSQKLIYLGIDEKQWKPIKKNNAIHNALEIPKGKKIIFTIGRFVEKKGYEYLIKAFAQVLKKEKNSVLVLGGYGPLKEKYDLIAEELGIKEKIYYPGFVDKTFEWIPDCDVFAVPSVTDSKGEIETFGIINLEAMACGKPLIATKSGGIVEIVDDRVDGLLCREKDSNDLAKKILNALKDKKLASRISRNARKKIMQKFAYSRTIENILEVYKKVLKKS